MEFLYRIKRKVVHGNKRGGTMGFPTANFNYYNRDDYIEDGVYIILARFKGEVFGGVTHIGRPRTFTVNKMIEVHLLDYVGSELYGHVMSVKFIKKIRDTKKFPNKDYLIEQINRDCLKARQYFINHKYK